MRRLTNVERSLSSDLSYKDMVIVSRLVDIPNSICKDGIYRIDSFFNTTPNLDKVVTTLTDISDEKLVYYLYDIAYTSQGSDLGDIFLLAGHTVSLSYVPDRVMRIPYDSMRHGFPLNHKNAEFGMTYTQDVLFTGLSEIYDGSDEVIMDKLKWIVEYRSKTQDYKLSQVGIRSIGNLYSKCVHDLTSIIDDS